MPSYRCYFLDDANHIRAYEIIDSETSGEAVDRALGMLKERSHHRSVELWEGAKRVYPPPASPP